MYVFSCFSKPPFFSHVKLASNQFDVDNFAFISLLTDSSSSDIIPDLRILNIPLFFLRENCQPYLHTEILNMSISISSLFVIMQKRHFLARRQSAFQVWNLPKTTSENGIHKYLCLYVNLGCTYILSLFFSCQFAYTSK